MARGRRKRRREQPAGEDEPAGYTTARELGAAPLRAYHGPGRSIEFQRIADGNVFKIAARGPREGHATVIRNVTADPLDWYIHRDAISDDQYSAGCALQTSFYNAFGSGVLSVQYDGVHGVTSHKGFSPSQGRWDSALAYIEALNRVRFMARGVLVAVIGWGYYANEAARRYGLPGREGMAVLRDGLDDLIGYYRPLLGLRDFRALADR